MKIVINSSFGGFSVSESARQFLRLESVYSEIERTDPLLVGLVEADARRASGLCARLKVVEIPDTATDWELDNYDGLESIIYVVDGKIHHLS